MTGDKKDFNGITKVPNEFAECVVTCSHFREKGPNKELGWCVLLDDRAPHLCEPYIENILRFVEKVRKQVDRETGILEQTFDQAVDGTVLLSLLRRYLNELAVE